MNVPKRRGGARERSTKEVRETVLAVKEVKIAGRRYIVCRNEEEARKDAETRAKLLDGLQRKLAAGAKSLVANTGYRRFLAAPEGDGFAIDPAKVEADAQFDGIFDLRTSLSMPALAVVLRYRNLLTLKQSFLAAKTLLATRPIFHRTDAAIRGHIFCTFLALVLRKELLDRLAGGGGVMPEWQCLIDDLADLSSVEIEQDGRRALLRTAPRPSIDPNCRALGITLPPVFQEVPKEKASQSAD